jgi:hypothetical protein
MCCKGVERNVKKCAAKENGWAEVSQGLSLVHSFAFDSCERDDRLMQTMSK